MHPLKSWHQPPPPPFPSRKKIMKTEKNTQVTKSEKKRVLGKGMWLMDRNFSTNETGSSRRLLRWIIQLQKHHLQKVFNAYISRNTIKPESHLALCDCFGSPEILRQSEIKLLMRLQGRELDWNWPWGSVGRIQEEWYNAGLTTSIWQRGEVLPVLRNGLKNWSQALVLLLN